MEPRLAEGPQVDQAADGAIHVAAAEQDWRTTTAPGLDAIMPGHELACIVLTVSSLEVAGVAATLSAHLAGVGIGCNIITKSGRDHLFVLNDQGTTALEILQAVAQSAARALADAEQRVHWPRWRRARGPL